MVSKRTCFALKYLVLVPQSPLKKQPWVAKKHPHLVAKKLQETQLLRLLIKADNSKGIAHQYNNISSKTIKSVNPG